MGGLHFHRCPKCKTEWQCTDHQCYRNNTKYDIPCHGTRCVHDVKQKDEKPQAPPEPDLFAPPPPAVATDTSIEAAAKIAPAASTLRRAVLQYIENNGPSTDEEMQKALGMPANTQRPRRRELVQQGLLYDSGARKKTASGRNAILWTDRIF